MQKELPAFTYVENDSDLEMICNKLSKEEWLCFDTEFVGEKRYHTLLCLIQLSSANGHYIVDPISIKNLER